MRDGDALPNTLEMARIVLFNLHVEEKTADEIRALIRTTYGLDSAKTLDQMLYKRVAKGKTFYKTADGFFGRIEFKSTMEEMRLPNTAGCQAWCVARKCNRGGY